MAFWVFVPQGELQFSAFSRLGGGRATDCCLWTGWSTVVPSGDGGFGGKRGYFVNFQASYQEENTVFIDKQPTMTAAINTPKVLWLHSGVSGTFWATNTIVPTKVARQIIARMMEVINFHFRLLSLRCRGLGMCVVTDCMPLYNSTNHGKSQATAPKPYKTTLISGILYKNEHFYHLQQCAL